jgi:hypothetical protein
VILSRLQSQRAELEAVLRDPNATPAYLNRLSLAFLEARARVLNFLPAQNSQVVRSLAQEARERFPAAGAKVIARRFAALVVALPVPPPQEVDPDDRAWS